MADVLLLHHALGVTPGIQEFATKLRAEGHRVEVPDLFEGELFSTTADGVAHAEQVGFDTLIERGVAAAAGLGVRLVVIGFSLGLLPAQKIAQTRSGVVGAVLCHGAVPVSTFGDGWPDSVAVQLHLSEQDPWAAEDMEAAQEVAAAAANGQLFVYPGSGHLIADSSHTDYDEELAEQLTGRTLEFLARSVGELDDEGRPEPPLAGDEVSTLLGFLDYQRATLAWKCDGLGAADLNVSVAASSITLGGLLKHMAFVEHSWFSKWLAGDDPLPPWDTVDRDADPDWEWHSAAGDSPEQLLALWQEAVARSRALTAEALGAGGLGQLAKRAWPSGEAASYRWVLVHMIEEYARHNGHADLIRESIDGVVGE